MGWGILGAARIADDAVIPALNASRLSRPVAIASRRAGPARDMAHRHHIPIVSQDYDAVLDNPAVDVVYVALVNSLHREWACRALSAGKHVLCEKPIALDARQATEMAAVANDSRRLLMEGLMYRFHPPLQEFVAQLDAPVWVNAKFSYPLDPGDDFRLHSGFGGGSLLDLGCYAVDLVRWIARDDPVEVVGVVERDEIDYSAAGVMRFAAGSLASIWTSFQAAEVQLIEVMTERSIRAFERPFTPWRPAGAAFAEGLEAGGPYREMVDAFSRAVIDQLPAPFAVAESIANLKVLDSLARPTTEHTS